MPFIRSSAFKRCAYVVSVILLLSEIMPLYSHCTKKKLVCVAIIALSSRQPFFYSKCTKLNICLSYNVKLVSDTKYL